MESIQVNNPDALVLDARQQNPLDFYSLLKQVKKYSFARLKKLPYFKIAQQLFLENELIVQVNKQKEYKDFIKNNYIFGNVIETFCKISDDQKLKELFFELLVANAYTKFDDNMNFDISQANDKMNSIVENEVNQYLPNLVQAITFYQENESEQDIKFFGFKNFQTYEFYYQWKRINAIIVKFFAQVGQKSLGQTIAKLFLINYEALREMEDFSTTSLIAHENLSEDYVFETSNDLLKLLFEEMETNNWANNLIKETMMVNLSIVTAYQLEEQKKQNFVQRILQNKKSKEKFRLFASSEIHDNLAQELKILSKTGMTENQKNENNFVHQNALKINGKVFRFYLKDLKAAKNVFKNYDLLDFTTALSETYFKARHLTFNKYYKHLEIIKLASLAYGYEFKVKDKLKMRDAQNIFELLILKIADEISSEFGQKIKTAIQNPSLTEEFFLTHQLTTLHKSPLWANYLQVCKEVYQDLKLNPLIAEKTVVYEILKNEDYALEKNKKAKTIVSENNIDSSEIIHYQSQIIYLLENEFKNERINIHVKYTRFMTETFGKLYLSDKPPLTTAGKIGLVFTYLILIIWAVVIILPILQVLIQALNFYSSNMSTGTEGKPGATGVFDFKNFKFGAENFDYLFKETLFSNWLINSLAIAVICMVLMVGITALIGYAFSRFRFKGKRIGLMSVMLIQMIPTVSSFVAFYIMLQLLQDKFGITGQIMLILVYTGGGIPGNVFVLKGYMDNISTDIDDAAKIDGCGNWATFIEIMLPLAKPMLSVIALWSFIGPFGDVLLPLVLLNDKSQYTMATGLQTLIGGGTTISQGSFAAGSLIVAIPISLLFLTLQKNITGGLSAAGVKG